MQPKSKKLTVLQILPELNAGGVERGTLEVARKLVKEGHRSIVVSNGGNMVEQLLDNGSEHIQLAVHRKSVFSLRKIKPLRKIIESIQPDILHVRSRLPAWLCYYALKSSDQRHKIKVVSTVHGMYSVNRYSNIMMKSDALIAVSKTIRAYILENYKDVPEEIIHLIYRGIDSNEFPEDFVVPTKWLQQWRREYPQTRDKIILTLPGRITRLKGQKSFLYLMAEIKKSNPEVHGLIVGNAHSKKMRYLNELKKLTKVLGIEKDITFTGQRKDIKEIYAISDLVFSLSNKAESFGRTVLEPLVMGRKVVAWNHGGVGEILTVLYPEGKVSLGNRRELIDVTLKVLNSENYPRKTNPFTLDSMLEKTIVLYQELADGDREKLTL